MLNDGYRVRSRSANAKKNYSRKVKRSRSVSRKVRRSRSVSRKVRRSRSAPRKVRSRSAPRKVRSRSAPRKVRRSRSAPRKVRSRSARRRKLTPEEKVIRKAKIISKALENCKKYGMNSEECLKTMRVISKPARDNIREIIRKLDEQKMKVLTSIPLRPVKPLIDVTSSSIGLGNTLKEKLEAMKRFRNIAGTSGKKIISPLKCNFVKTWIVNIKQEYNGKIPKDVYEKFVKDQEALKIGGLTKLEIEQCMKYFNESVCDKTSNILLASSKIEKNASAVIKSLNLNTEQNKIVNSLISSIVQNFVSNKEAEKILSTKPDKIADVSSKILADDKALIVKIVNCTNEQVLEKVKNAFPEKILSLDTAKLYYPILKDGLKKQCNIVLTLVQFIDLLSNNNFILSSKDKLGDTLKQNNVNTKTISEEVKFDLLPEDLKISLLSGFRDREDKIEQVIEKVVEKEENKKLIEELKIKKPKGRSWMSTLGIGLTLTLLTVALAGGAYKFMSGGAGGSNVQENAVSSSFINTKQYENSTDYPFIKIKEYESSSLADAPSPFIVDATELEFPQPRVPYANEYNITAPERVPGPLNI